MAQQLEAITDVSVVNWSPSGASTAWEALANASDLVTVNSSNNPSAGDLAIVRVADPGTPDTGTHSITYRYRKSAAAGRTMTFRVFLRHGTTAIASWEHTDIGATEVTQTQSWTPPVGIVWSDLRIAIEAETTSTGAGRNAVVARAFVTVPDPIPDGVEVSWPVAELVTEALAPTIDLEPFSMLWPHAEAITEVPSWLVVLSGRNISWGVSETIVEVPAWAPTFGPLELSFPTVEMMAEAVAWSPTTARSIEFPAPDLEVEPLAWGPVLGSLPVDIGWAGCEILVDAFAWIVTGPDPIFFGKEDPHMTATRSNAFAPPPFDSLADPSRYAILRDEFAGGAAYAQGSPVAIGDLGWVPNENIEESTAAVEAVAGRIGVMLLTAGVDATPAAGDNTVWALPAAAFKLGDEQVYAAFEINLPSVAAVEAHVGFASAAEDDRGANAILLELDASHEPELLLVTVDDTSNVNEVDTTIVAAADTWYLVEFVLTADEVQVRVNGGEVFRTTEDIPASTVTLFPVIKLETETTATKAIRVDSFTLRQRKDRGF